MWQQFCFKFLEYSLVSQHHRWGSRDRWTCFQQDPQCPESRCRCPAIGGEVSWNWVTWVWSVLRFRELGVSEVTTLHLKSNMVSQLFETETCSRPWNYPIPVHLSKRWRSRGEESLRPWWDGERGPLLSEEATWKRWKSTTCLNFTHSAAFENMHDIDNHAWPVHYCWVLDRSWKEKKKQTQNLWFYLYLLWLAIYSHLSKVVRNHYD